MPIHRLRDADPSLIVDDMLQDMAVADRAEWAEAFTDGRIRVEAPPDEDRVHVVLVGDPRGRRIRLHRSLVVPSWPADDVPGPGEYRPMPRPRFEG